MNEQLTFIDCDMDKSIRRKAERLITSYRNIEAVIESMEKDLPQQKITPSYEAKESQSSPNTTSQVEKLVIIRDKITQKKIQKQKLDIIYKSLSEHQKAIWNRRYLNGVYDDIVIMKLDISRRHYFRIKAEMLKVVAESFYLF